MKNGIFVLVFLASALTRIFLLGSAPERLVKSLGQDLTCAVFSDQNYENENETSTTCIFLLDWTGRRIRI